MPVYALNVTVEERNENFDDEMIAYRRHLADRREAYSYNATHEPEPPREFRTMRVLDVRLTPEEWEAVKKSVMETFE